MSAGKAPQEVLGGIPGWGGATVRELPGGLTNRTLRVDKDGRCAVLKIDPSPRKPPFNSRREEALIQQRAAALGRANEVLYVGDTVLLSEWADGEVWTREQLDDDENLVGLGCALREIHGLPLTGRVFDLQAAARQYTRQLDERDLADARAHLAVIESMRGPINLSCCHNDLVVENIISTPEIRFLDWEYACDNDPLFDIAIVVAHHGLPGRQADLLLDAYFDGNGARWRQQLNVQMRLYEALNWLWAAAASADRRSVTSVQPAETACTTRIRKFPGSCD